MTDGNAERIRQDVARAVVPLLGEYESLTMPRIAEAAGVSEAELLAVFPDMEAVVRDSMTALTDVVAATLDPAEALRDIAAIDSGRPLAARLAAVVEVIDAYHRRARVDFNDLLSRMGSAPARREEFAGLGRTEEFRQAVAIVLRPDEHDLRLPADLLAAAFLGMVDGLRPAQTISAAQIADLFLAGARRGDQAAK